ncbi:hypothetical protein BGW36DRAFT_372523 [Talaromyces proteolyticus]|uniref:Uncharacterized protein n=1 Tax=Talaromyces proteolyticus TaxID=1131652 RepID=A0AAD4KYT4_9EURO|nr:uncharacterized protein BGW36DRAFT_372523 [Talaromyces proteolyticus]KAH8702288.1 hypothetical protein BGW36DRAFT_372523 [Talaromyces proteolyticus]
MVVVRRRKGLSPRYLTFRHARCLLRRQGLLSCDSEYIQPGHQRLRSYHVPGLVGGEYTITTEQTVTPPGGQGTTLESQQTFYVDTPEFQLPEDIIHSVYPPQGHEEWVTSLPHIIFNKPSLPWDWAASRDEDEEDYRENRNRVPWLALLAFTKEELELSNPDLTISDGIFNEPAKQTSTFAVNMPASQIKCIKRTAIPLALDTDKDISTDVILLKRDLFTSLFTKFDKMGKAVPSAGPDVRPYRFLAHRRDVNTEGMAYAALTATEDDQMSFGVIFAHRSGPLSTTQPTQCIVHLVSIRGVEGMQWPIPDECHFVAMSSLHSWSYSCYPATTPTLWEQFAHLGATCNLLRYNPTEGDENEIRGFHEKVGNRVLARLKNGYTLTRYRVKTGESTACFMRGAFVPVKDNQGADTWERLSNIGSDLQILDQQLGMMDITYSAAWQLGRALAITDQGFVASLGRVRKQIYDRGMQYAQLEALSSQGVRTRSQIIAALPSMVKSLRQLTTSQALVAPDYLARSRRWHRPAVEPIDLSYKGRVAARGGGIRRKTLESHFERAALEVSAAYDENSPGTPLDEPYNEFNTPFSADWMVVLRWILDRMVLSNIPTQYLVTDSSHLPLESIRFFQIDTQWMNALIDGALSLANYLDQEDDLVREAIFHALNWYRKTPIRELEDIPPPFPVFGFLMRSGLVTRFPDLKLEVFRDETPIDDLMLLRHEIVNPDTMLCLFAQPPSAESFNKIWLTQPPHQQTFISGVCLKPKSIVMRFRKAYTESYEGDDVTEEILNPRWRNPTAGLDIDPEDPDECHSEDEDVVDVEDNAAFLWDYQPPSGPKVEARRLLMDNLAKFYLETAQEKMDSSRFCDTFATSALMGTQMESFTWRLKIELKDALHQQVEVSRGPRSAIPPAPSLSTDEPQTTTPVAPDQAENPQFRYAFRSTDTPKEDNNITMTRVAQDLVFSINHTGRAQAFNLQSITITLPLGSLYDEPPCIMPSYEGAGAYMLTNVRFNPLVSVDTEKLVIRLLPRTNLGYVPVANCNDLSFILSGVFVNRISTTAPVPMRGTVKEKYLSQNEPVNPSTELPTLLMKPDLNDPDKLSMADLRTSFLRSVAMR